ncbi:MAG: phospho-N-acetylmuramoyl-pentapeptide-transferase [Dethiobacteria bacterium]
MMALLIIASLLVAFILALIACPLFIKRMKKLQYGQQIREDGPARHASKAGTPTMGGVVILLTAALTAIILAGSSLLTYIILLVMLGCGMIGFIDDYLKIAKNRSLGLKARSKLAGEIIIAALFILALYFAGHYNSAVNLPFSDTSVNLGFIYPLFVFLIVTSATNTVNLTDGVDGLAAGTTVIALAAFLYIALKAGLPVVAVICAALIGACLGFLVYNRHPARLFMGDVGSLGIGGAFAAVAVLTKTELLLIVIGGIFVIEALAVIAQVISFQLTGRRILLMAPLHHHFELKGWSEWRVVGTFWVAALIFALIGVSAYG